MEAEYGDGVTAEDISAAYQSVAEFAEPDCEAPAETEMRLARKVAV